MLTVGSPSVVQLYCRMVEEFSHIISCAKYKISIEYSFILNYLLYSMALLVIQYYLFNILYIYLFINRIDFSMYLE
jgi:hypothetical protein